MVEVEMMFVQDSDTNAAICTRLYRTRGCCNRDLFGAVVSIGRNIPAVCQQEVQAWLVVR